MKPKRVTILSNQKEIIFSMYMKTCNYVKHLKATRKWIYFM